MKHGYFSLEGAEDALFSVFYNHKEYTVDRDTRSHRSQCLFLYAQADGMIFDY